MPKIAARLPKSTAIAAPPSTTCPNTRALYEVFAPIAAAKFKSPSTQGKWLAKRGEIASDSLCDDVLKYLTPTLKQYKNPIILDVNPGSCIWSSKLHEALKPKLHLLIEPDEAYYKPFIEPLLKRSGSTFRHSNLIGFDTQTYWANWTQLLDGPELQGERPTLDTDAAALRQIDQTVILTGNLQRSDIIKKADYRHVDPTLLLYQHMADAVLTNNIFQRSGLVRMLLWVADSTIPAILPASLKQRTAFTVGFNSGVDAFQIAAPSVSRLPKLTQAEFEEYPHVSSGAILQQTSDLVREQGIFRSTKPSPVSAYDSSVTQGPNPFHTTCKTYHELRQLTNAFIQNLTRLADAKQIKENRRGKGLLEKAQQAAAQIEFNEEYARSLVYPQVRAMIQQSTHNAALKSSPSRALKVAAVTDMHVQLLHLEAELAELAKQHPDYPEQADASELVLDASRQLDETIEQNFRFQVSSVAKSIAPRIQSSYMSQPALLARDNRPTDPLTCKDDEFWPPQKMSLVMLTPQTYDISVPGVIDRNTATSLYHVFLKVIFYSRTGPLVDALEKLAPNAARDLIPQVPALCDPRKGGRLDPTKIICRSLTEDVLLEIFRRFCEWPFRPSNIELLAAHAGGPVADEQDDETEEVGADED